MRLLRRHRNNLLAAASPLLLVLPRRRRYATKYTARVTSISPSGRSLSAEVPPPPPLPTDVRGYPIPRRDLVCAATNILLQSRRLRNSPALPPDGDDDAFSRLSSFFHSLSPSLTPSEASEILKSINCPRLALKFFRSCPSLSPNFQHNAFTYNRILLILSKSTDPERFDQVRSIVEEMEKSHLRGTISTVNLLIGIFGGNTEDLDKCVGLARKWELKLNCYTHKCLVQAHLRSRNSKNAFDVYWEMRRRGYKLDIFAYNMLLDALAKDEKVDEASKVFDDMKKKWCEPDEFSYTILIRLNGKIGKPDEAMVLFQEMMEKGLSFNIISYNTIIEALARGRMVDKVIFIFSKMVKNECRPNEFTYSVILNLLVMEGQLGRLDEVI
ncbi:hypothetical protein BT93_F2480 [Corymbia citriodora subsp. variegata]|nr:hypothetical protein BT93_F2480 [Corymbia citriodora subsp. variegata]